MLSLLGIPATIQIRLFFTLVVNFKMFSLKFCLTDKQVYLTRCRQYMWRFTSLTISCYSNMILDEDKMDKGFFFGLM